MGALGGWVGAGLAGFGSLGIESTGAPIEVSRATSTTARAEDVDAPRATALGQHDVSVADIASGSVASSDTSPTPQPGAVPVAIASLSTLDPERNEAKEAPGSVVIADTPTDPVQNATRPAVSSEALDACPEPDVCIDQYLWSLYERTPKVDTIKVEERIKV